MKSNRGTNQLYASRAIEHLRTAIRYGDRGRDTFFDREVPDTFLLVEAELRKSYESLNRLGQSFFTLNTRFNRERIGEIRQVLTHDYSEVDKEFVWSIVRDEAPGLVHLLTRARFPKE